MGGWKLEDGIYDLKVWANGLKGEVGLKTEGEGELF